jgi:hypothetical protein
VVDSMRLEARDDLRVEVASDAALRVGWGEPDWLGAIGLRIARNGTTHEPRVTACERSRGCDDLGDFDAIDLGWSEAPLPIRTQVRAYRDAPVLVFRLEASADLRGVATRVFDAPSVAWPWLRPDLRDAGGLPDGARVFGHQYTEFALPTASDPSCSNFLLLPFRPAVVEPLFVLAPDGRTLMLAPLDAFHEQVIAVPRNAEAAASGVRCGWHGDLDEIPAGFASELAVWAGSGPRACLDAWAAFLRERHRTVRPGRYADELGGKLSYWTDNGAAYWYRTEPGLGGVAPTLRATAASLRAEEIPYRVFQLDSWFYPHEKLRPFDDPDISVPPTGLITWDARPDILPDGIPALRASLGDPPLATHCRHFASASPYFATHDAWHDGDRAHPKDAALYAKLLHQAASWGVVTFEHDWLIECFLGVRGLREAPGRARAWQEGLDAAAGEHGLTLQWCMASPADFFQSVTLRNVTSIRTSGDYKYVIGNGALWAWFLYGNALARALGLHPFKDVFLTFRDGSGPRDGDPHAEAEALIAALSAGPVGLGDRVGRTDRTLVLRTCRSDGVLLKPDVPIAALDRCFRAHAVMEHAPLVGATHSTHALGAWIYLASFHASRVTEPLAFRVDLADLGADRPVAAMLAYDWRSGRMERVAAEGGFDLRLGPLDWDYRVLCPIARAGGAEIAVVGDASRYATAGDKRIADVRSSEDGLTVDVLGASEERVCITGWSSRAPVRAVAHDPHGAHAVAIRWDAESGRFDLDLVLPSCGWTQLRIAMA